MKIDKCDYSVSNILPIMLWNDYIFNYGKDKLITSKLKILRVSWNLTV